MTIRKKLMLSFFAVALLIGLLGGAAFYRALGQAEHIVHHETLSVARTAAALLSEYVDPSGRSDPRDLQDLQEHIVRLKELHRRDIVIVDSRKTIIADAVPYEIGTVFVHDKNNEVGKTLRDGQVRTFTEISAAYPHGIRQMVLPLDDREKQIGAVILEYTPLYEEVLRETKRSAAVFLLLFVSALGLSLLIGYLISQNISRPLAGLQQAALRVAAGDVEVKVEQDSRDELGSLSGSFNTMVQALKRSQDQQATMTCDLLEESERRRESEEALRASEQKFRTLYESATDGIFILDLEGHFIDVNRTAYERLGYTKEEMLSFHISQLNAPEFNAPLRERMARIREEGQTLIESGHRRKDGSVMPVEVNARLLKFGGRTVILSVIRDLTERMKVQEELRRHREELVQMVDERTRELSRSNELLRREIADRERMERELAKAQKLESLGVLAGGIAHDFNNLLTSILGNVSLSLLDVGAGHPAHDELVRAERATLRAQDLTQQLLTFSKGGAPLKQTASIADLVRETAGFALHGGRVKCDFLLPDGLWLVDIDAGQMSQVVHNLVINADHAMPDGGTISVRGENVRLPASGGPALPAGHYVKISIVDTGVGISPEHLPKIFDPYFTTKQRGSGLGLATSYSIIQKHGGSISVASTLGKGTTFDIYLPASSAAAEKSAPTDTRLPVATGNVLIMDDEESVRETAGSILRRLGYSVAFAEDGGRAIEMYREAQQAGAAFDVVIMDLTIPGGMGGREALMQLREIDPEIRAIVSSGYSNDPVMAEYKEHGFAGVVSKPYRMRDLGHAVQRVLEKNPGA